MPSSDSDERWMHDLRNVVNALGSGVALSRRLIEKGRSDEAHEVLVDTERSLQQCFRLLAGQRGFEGDVIPGAIAPGEPEARLNN